MYHMSGRVKLFRYGHNLFSEVVNVLWKLQENTIKDGLKVRRHLDVLTLFFKSGLYTSRNCLTSSAAITCSSRPPKKASKPSLRNCRNSLSMKILGLRGGKSGKSLNFFSS